MKTTLRTVSASEFKARCLALIDEVGRTGHGIIISKRGKPVAQLQALETAKPKSLRGSVVHEEDIVSPIGVEWESAR